MLFTGVSTAVRSIAASSGAMFSSSAARRRASAGIRRAKVVVVGSGRMGQIRSSLIYANPRFELCGIVDTNFDAASVLAKTYEVLSPDSSLIHYCQISMTLSDTTLTNVNQL
jgi:hypothetical protein